MTIPPAPPEGGRRGGAPSLVLVLVPGPVLDLFPVPRYNGAFQFGTLNHPKTAGDVG